MGLWGTMKSSFLQVLSENFCIFFDPVTCWFLAGNENWNPQENAIPVLWLLRNPRQILLHHAKHLLPAPCSGATYTFATFPGKRFIEPRPRLGNSCPIAPSRKDFRAELTAVQGKEGVQHVQAQLWESLRCSSFSDSRGEFLDFLWFLGRPCWWPIQFWEGTFVFPQQLRP